MKAFKKRSTALLICTALCIMTVLSTKPVNAEELTKVSGYYEIKSERDFNLIKDYRGEYRIVSDITLNNPVPLGTFSNPFTGVLIGALDGDIKKKPTITIDSENFSGLINFLNGGTVRNIIVDGNIKTSSNIAAGIVSCAKSGKIKDCINKANITCEYNGKDFVYAGGIIAYTYSPTELEISGCENYGAIICNSSSLGHIGGIGGMLVFSSQAGGIKNCKNSGEINTSLENAGGISGNISTLTNISFCANTGKIINRNQRGYVGGIAGIVSGGISKSFNSGELISEHTSGGIAGRVISNISTSFSDNYNMGSLTSKISSGGIVGSVFGIKEITVDTSYNCGKLKPSKSIFEIAPNENSVLNHNYYLSDTTKQNADISPITSESMKSLDNLEGFSTEIWAVDKQGVYQYPQIINNKFGSLEISYNRLNNGYLFAEAEDGIVMPSEVTVVEDNNFSGNSYIKFNSVHIDLSTTQPIILEPVLSYTFELTERADISVWIRVKAPNAAADSLFAGFNNQYNIVLLSIDNNFYWKKVSIKNLDAGIHTFDIFPRELNSIDRVLITSIGLFSPSGLGGTPDDKIEEISIHKGPEFKPKQGHPRVYLTKEDIPKILENTTKPQNYNAWQKHLENLENDSDGKLPPASLTNNFDSNLLEIIESRAFDYIIRNNEEAGLSAISSMINFVETMSTDSALYWGYYSYAGEAIHKLAIVYDWCYPLLTESDKEKFHKMFVTLAKGTEMGWPPVDQNLLGGHGGETQLLRDMLAVGIAMYDDYPYIYNNVAGRFFDEAIDYRKEFLYKSHFHVEGDHYFQVRYGAEIASTLLMDALGLPNIFGEDQHYVPYWEVYARRPDGSTLRSGDSMHDSNPAGKYYDSYYEPMFITANYYNDPYLKREAMRENIGLKASFPYANQSLSTVEFLIFNNPDLADRSLKELPLTKYFPSPQGGMIARTDWSDGMDSPAVVAEMKMSEFWFPSHSHLDAGAFQIYYKGALANDTGYYATNVGTGSDTDNKGRTYFGSVHFFNYYRRTIAHNCMLVYDPDEQVLASNAFGVKPVNDGGQRYYSDNGYETFEDFKKNYDSEIKMGETLAHEFGIDTTKPNYTYLKGDLSYAYSDKVSGYERSFMFLNLKNEKYPAAMMVFDRVESSNPEFKKTWLLHGIDEPQINGTQSILTDTREGNNGKLTVDTLLPENPAISKIGGPGKDFWVNDINWNGLPSIGGSNESTDAWRIEVSPSTPCNEDYFLNVMQVSDALPVSDPLPVSKIDAGTHIGAKIADRIVLFGKQKDRTSSNVTFSFEGDGQFEITVADLKEGTWKVNKDGKELCNAVVTKDGGIAVFNSDQGKYELTFIKPEGTREIIIAEPETVDDIYILSGNSFQYTTAYIENGISLIPLSELAELLSLELNYDNQTGETILNGYGKSLKIRENSKIATGLNGNIELITAPVKIHNDLLVPLRSISEEFYHKIEYFNYPKTIVFNSAASKPEKGYATIINCKWESNLEASNGYYTYDNNDSTGWATAAAAGSGNCSITYYFGTPQEISSIEGLFSRSSQRSFKYDILISDDNVNWQTIISDGNTVITKTDSDYQTIDLKGGVKTTYIKYIGKGNTGNNANNILEIKFKN